MAITVIATALQGSIQAQFAVPGGPPAHVRLDMVSPDFPTNSALSFDVTVEQSFDGGATWRPWFASGVVGGTQGQPGKFGVPITGLWWIVVQYDGAARLARCTITAPTPFTWGLTATVV